MAGFKAPDFNQRAQAANEARQKALEALRSKPAPDQALIAQRQAAQAAKEAAAAEKRAARRAAEEQAKEEAREAKRLEAERLEAERLAAMKPAKTEEELKAIRDARYAARKKRKKGL